jgi:hypothetical protein
MPINLNNNVLNSLGVDFLNESTIIQNNLLFHWDANNMASYPGSGTSWFSLTSNSRTATLNNGPTYDNSTNGGFITFDGSNDSATFTTFTLGNGELPWTICAWVRTTTAADGLGAGSILSNSSGGPVYAALSINTGKITYWTYSGGWFRIMGATTVNNNRWNFLCWAQKSNYYMDMYVNGVIDLSNGYSASGNNNPIDIMGASWAAPFNGSIGSVMVYNTTLSAAQILQNYNSTRHRFGV